MYIKDIRLFGFGRFTGREVAFAEGMNIIYGPNEAGKTTIVDAIAGVFYGFRGRREDLRQLRQRYVPSREENLYKAGVTMVTEDFGPLYIERDFLTNKAEIKADGSCYTGLSVEELAARYFGTANLRLFKSAMLIRQEEIAVLAREEVSPALSRKLVSSGQKGSLKSVFSSLGKKYLELNRGLIRSTGRPGPVRSCLDTIQSLEDELRAMDALADEHTALASEAETLEETVCDLKMRLAEITPLVTGYRRYIETKNHRDIQFGRQTDIQSILDKVAGKKALLKDTEEKLRDIEDTSAKLSAQKGRRSLLLPGIGILTAMMSLAGLLIGGTPGYITAAMLFITGAAVFILGIARNKLNSGKQTKMQAGNEYRELEMKREWLLEGISQILAGSDEEELHREMTVLAVKIHNLQAEMEIFNCGLTGDDFARLATEEKEKLAALEEEEKELIRVRTSLEKFEQYALQGKDRWTTETRLASARAELKSLEIRKKGITEAVRILKEAVHEAQADLVPQVTQRASQLMAGITGGRYAQIELVLDTSGISLKVRPKEAAQSIEAGDLSAGTRDQLYLAMRVAIAEFIAGGQKCPLILDDPFVNFDAGRLSLTINMLRELSSKHQIILLTKDQQYARECPEAAVPLE